MAIVSIVGVILLVSRLIIPELVDTIFKLSNNIPEYVKEIQALLEKTSMNKPMVHKYVNQITFDWDKISGELITFLQDGATSMLNSTVSAITDVVQFIVSFALGFVFALNALLQKEKLSMQVKRYWSLFYRNGLRSILYELEDYQIMHFQAFYQGSA